VCLVSAVTLLLTVVVVVEGGGEECWNVPHSNTSDTKSGPQHTIQGKSLSKASELDPALFSRLKQRQQPSLHQHAWLYLRGGQQLWVPASPGSTLQPVRTAVDYQLLSVTPVVDREI
jgi:hypothetical protein